MTPDTKTSDKRLIRELKTLALDRTEVSDAGRKQFLQANKLLHGQPLPEIPGTYFLVAVSGAPPNWQLIEPPYIVGRHKSCNLALPKGWVSNQHCKVVLDGTNWVIRQCGFSNHIPSKQRPS